MTDGVQPVIVDGIAVLSPRQLHTPFSTLRIRRILPGGLDSFLEEVVVRTRMNQRWRYDIVVKSGERSESSELHLL